MSKKNKQRFEFCVGTSNNHRSTVWKVVVSKSDVYIIPTSSNNYFKVSLHGSGVCQMAITGEHLEEFNIPRDERPGQRWKCEAEEINANIIFSIAFLNCFLVDFEGKDNLKAEVNIIPPPEDGRNTEILFYKVKATLPVEGTLPDGYNYLCAFQLSNGEVLVLCYHYPVFTDGNKQIFIKAYREVIAEKERAGIKTDMVSGFLSAGEEGSNIRLIEIFV